MYKICACRKYDDFFEIVRPVVITQVVSSSISIVGLILLVELVSIVFVFLLLLFNIVWPLIIT